MRELVVRLLEVSVDGGPAQLARAHPSATLAEHASKDEVRFALHVRGEQARLTLAHDESWRSGWAIEVARDGEPHVLRAGGAIELADARGGPWVLQLRTQRRALVRALSDGDVTVPLEDAAFHRHTRQSSREGAPRWAWMTPTEPEDRPYWELDLGAPRFVARARVVVGALPEGAQATLSMYVLPAPSGEPPRESSFERVLGAPIEQLDVGAVARFVRVSVGGELASLEVRALEVLAAELHTHTLYETMRRAFALHRDRTLFLARQDDGSFAPMRTYGETWDRAMALGRALAARLEPAQEKRTFVVLALRNRPEWIEADLGALSRGYVVVPIAPEDARGSDRLTSMMERVQPAAIVCEADAVDALLAAAPDVRLVVVCSPLGGASAPPARAPRSHTPQAGRAGASAPLRGVSAAQARERCVGYEELIAERRERAVLPARRPDEDDVHTVLFTSGSTGTPKGAMRSYRTFRAMITSYGVPQPARHLSFQPLSHLSERMFVPALLLHGAELAFSRGGAHLMDELRAFEPTMLGSVPRLYEVLHASHARRLRAAAEAEPEVRFAELEARELARSRGAFGDRLQALTVGSAPVSAEVLAFLRRCFADVWVSEGYGSTELGTIAVDGRIAEHVQVKLVPLEGGDPSRGAPREPEGALRGEIWVRSPHVIAGYLGEAEATRATVDADGFVATGDLGERDPDGRIRVVGRLRNAVKLAQGEFVSAERIEGVLGTTSGVDRIYVHAEAGAAAVSALVVPAVDADASALPAALRVQGRRAGLAAWELPSALLVLEPGALSVEDGTLTASGKLARSAIAARYGEALRELARPREDADPIEPIDSGVSPLAARVRRVAARVLGRAIDALPLADAGVDSLTAAELMAALGDELGREVPLALWFEAPTLDALAARLEHVAVDLGAMSALVQEDRARAVALELTAPARAPARTVLVTGATGFLGAHLVEALLERTELDVLCLVRAADEPSARGRLDARFAELGIRTNARVDVVVGDLASPRLGLPDERWDALAERIDVVLHAGATVSWLAPYSALRAPNVHGTTALLELAGAHGRARAFHHVSTISTAPADGDERSSLSLEAVRGTTPYALTKWIAEEHVRTTGTRGLPVAIHRPAMIAPHSARGVGNVDDFLHRYLLGAAELGLYVDDASARVDVTPVDYVASGIVALLDRGATDTSHFANIEGSPTFAELGRMLRQAGLDVRPASYAEFRSALVHRRPARLAPLAAFFPDGRLALGMGPWPCARTVERVRALGVERPTIDEGYVARWVERLRTRGLVR
jgi:fatty acid CoA ligase FadD9